MHSEADLLAPSITARIILLAQAWHKACTVTANVTTAHCSGIYRCSLSRTSAALCCAVGVVTFLETLSSASANEGHAAGDVASAQQILSRADAGAQPIGRWVLTSAKNPKKTDDTGWTSEDDVRLYKWKGGGAGRSRCDMARPPSMTWSDLRLVHSNAADAHTDVRRCGDDLGAESCWKALTYLSMASLAYAAGHSHRCLHCIFRMYANVAAETHEYYTYVMACLRTPPALFKVQAFCTAEVPRTRWQLTGIKRSCGSTLQKLLSRYSACRWFWDTKLLWTECHTLPCDASTPPLVRLLYCVEMGHYIQVDVLAGPGLARLSSMQRQRKLIWPRHDPLKQAA